MDMGWPKDAIKCNKAGLGSRLRACLELDDGARECKGEIAGPTASGTSGQCSRNSWS